MKLLSAKPPYFIPVIASVSIAYMLSLATLEVKPAYPMSASVSLGVSAASVVSAALAAVFIAFLIRLRRFHAIRVIITSALVYTSVVSSAMLADRIASQPSLPLAATVGILMALASLSRGLVGLAGQISLSAIFSNAIVSSFGVKLPVALLALLSVYDLWAVYRGPVKKLITEVERVYQADSSERADGSPPSFTPIVVEIKEGYIGFGDIVSYALASSVAGRVCPAPLSIAPLTALLAGVYLSFKLARRFRHFPGLPIPISLWAITVATVQILT